MSPVKLSFIFLVTIATFAIVVLAEPPIDCGTTQMCNDNVAKTDPTKGIKVECARSMKGNQTSRQICAVLIDSSMSMGGSGIKGTCQVRDSVPAKAACQNYMMTSSPSGITLSSPKAYFCPNQDKKNLVACTFMAKKSK